MGATLWQLRRSVSLKGLDAGASPGELGPSLCASSQFTGANLLRLLTSGACLAVKGSLLLLCLSMCPCSQASSGSLRPLQLPKLPCCQAIAVSLSPLRLSTLGCSLAHRHSLMPLRL